jgi:threonine aldolase
MFFASDNCSGVPHQVLDALTRANSGYAMGYGNDALSCHVQDQIRAVFEAPNAAVYLVPTGSAANALALSVYCPPWGSIYCHKIAHIEDDECGAPAFYSGGGKLTLIDGADGKMTPEALAAALTAAQTSIHNVQKSVLSLTNITECGTLYSLAEISALTKIAKAHGLACHLDGARFANAVVSLGCSASDMSWRSGIDVVTFGGTKNGLLGVEAVVFFNPEKAWEFELRRKRGGHLFSKYRYLAAQMDAYATDDLWRDLATKANAAAKKLEAAILATTDTKLLHPRGGNALFASWPRAVDTRLRAAGAVYNYWPGDPAPTGPAEELISARLVCSWSTTDAEIAEFKAHLRG